MKLDQAPFVHDQLPLVAPFSKKEKEIFLTTGQLFGDFSKLEATHPSDLSDVANAIHQLQDILGRRVLRREFPGSYASYEHQPSLGKWVVRKGITSG